MNGARNPRGKFARRVCVCQKTGIAPAENRKIKQSQSSLANAE